MTSTPPPVSSKVATKAIAKKPGISILKLKQQSLAKKQNTDVLALCALVIGPRQAGKSTLIGTAEGTVFYITTADEIHSIETAKAMAENTYGADIIPFVIDIKTEDEQGDQLEPDEYQSLNSDQAISRLDQVLDALLATDNVHEEIQYVVVDSVASVHEKITDTTAIRGDKDKFRADRNAQVRLKDMCQKLTLLHTKGINVVVTCPAIVEQDKITGLYDQIEPYITGFRTNFNLVGIFPDIAATGKVNFEDDDGNIESQYCLQFAGTASKDGKRASDQSYRCVNFRPRINGLLEHETPTTLPADLKKLAAYKRKAKIRRMKRRQKQQQSSEE